jgi:zinc and cadmium transporter
MNILIGLSYAILTTFIISLISFVGILSITINKNKLQNILIYFIAFAAGTLLGSALLHLIPEAAKELDIRTLNIIVVISFITFFLIEKFLHWHHHHEYIDDKHVVGYMNLIGDALHNFLDGIIIVAAFLVDIKLGFTTAVAVILHEIPQEIGDFGILFHSGFSVKKALLSNFFIALVSMFGVLLGYIWVDASTSATYYIMAFAAGGFIYIATADLLPEIRDEINLRRSWISFSVFVLGIILMYLL